MIWSMEFEVDELALIPAVSRNHNDQAQEIPDPGFVSSRGEQPKILHEESATSWRFFGQDRVINTGPINCATWFGQNFYLGVRFEIGR